MHGCVSLLVTRLQVEKLFMEMLTAIDVASQNPAFVGARNHHLYINIVPEFKVRRKKLQWRFDAPLCSMNRKWLNP